MSAPRLCILVLTMLFAACVPSTLKPAPHFVLGDPYKVGSLWYYPRETFDLDETGIATVAKNGARLTADGEVFDQTALAAAHPTMQLPAIAELTNLESGRVVTVRVNDRGSGDPHRLVEVTRRTAVLLGMQVGGVARVRLRVLPNESHAAAEASPGAPALALAAAPRGGVVIADLPPPPGARQSTNRRTLAPRAALARDPVPTPTPPMRMPETVKQTTPRPGTLVVRLDTFDEYHYAAFQRARMSWSSAYIVPVFEGRTKRFRVEVGPLPSIQAADALLDKALASGIPDARIVVD